VQFKDLWTSGSRYYLVASQKGADRIESIVGPAYFETVASSGGKLLLRNVKAKPTIANIPASVR
jgi:hypothetical protein